MQAKMSMFPLANPFVFNLRIHMASMARAGFKYVVCFHRLGHHGAGFKYWAGWMIGFELVTRA